MKMSLKPKSLVLVLLITCVVQAGALLAQERKSEAPPASEKAKAWFAFYHREAEQAYRFKLEPGEVPLELDPTPILRWTNPLEEGTFTVWFTSGDSKGGQLSSGNCFR